jgi:superfamily II DNA or RNA helicase
MELVVELLRDQQESPVVFWLAHSEELCRQAFETFVRLWEHSEDRSVRACRLWGHHETPISVDKPLFIAAGFQKLVSLTATGDHPGLNALRSRTMLVVVDEAHRSVAPTYKRVIDYLIARGAKLIGLSATPGRSTEHEMEKLFGLYFGSIVGIKAPSGTSVVRFLQEQRVLSRIQTDSIISPVSFSLSPRELRYLETNLDFPAEFLNRVGRNDVRNAEILARVIGECRAGRRVVSFACNLEHSRFLANVLSFLGFSAAHIDGNTDRAARQHIVRQFRDGQLQVISNYGVLSTGFDAPNADVVLIARPTRSAILYSQMIGRGLRGPAMGGSEICRLLDVRDNIENIGPIDLLYSEFAEYWCE